MPLSAEFAFLFRTWVLKRVTIGVTALNEHEYSMPVMICFDSLSLVFSIFQYSLIICAVLRVHKCA